MKTLNYTDIFKYLQHHENINCVAGKVLLFFNVKLQLYY